MSTVTTAAREVADRIDDKVRTYRVSRARAHHLVMKEDPDLRRRLVDEANMAASTEIPGSDYVAGTIPAAREVENRIDAKVRTLGVSRDKAASLVIGEDPDLRKRLVHEANLARPGAAGDAYRARVRASTPKGPTPDEIRARIARNDAEIARSAAAIARGAAGGSHGASGRRPSAYATGEFSEFDPI